MGKDGCKPGDSGCFSANIKGESDGIIIGRRSGISRWYQSNSCPVDRVDAISGSPSSTRRVDFILLYGYARDDLRIIVHSMGHHGWNRRLSQSIPCTKSGEVIPVSPWWPGMEVPCCFLVPGAFVSHPSRFSLFVVAKVRSCGADYCDAMCSVTGIFQHQIPGNGKTQSPAARE